MLHCPSSRSVHSNLPACKLQPNAFAFAHNFEGSLEVSKASATVFLHCFLVNAVNDSGGKSAVIAFLDDVIAEISFAFCSGKQRGFQYVGCKMLVNIAGRLCRTGYRESDEEYTEKKRAQHFWLKNRMTGI